MKSSAQKKIILTLAIAMAVVAMSVGLAGCSKKNAIWLTDGQTLTVIDNTLGEGINGNVRFTHTFKNSVVDENKGVLYVLPTADDDTPDRYFATIRMKTTGIADEIHYIEITNIKNGDTVSHSQLMDSISNADMLAQGLHSLDGTNTATHYSAVTSTTRNCYQVSRGGNITVWTDKSLAVTITSPTIQNTPLSFTIDWPDFHRLTYILGQTGDSWSVE